MYLGLHMRLTNARSVQDIPGLRLRWTSRQVDSSLSRRLRWWSMAPVENEETQNLGVMKFKEKPDLCKNMR